MSERPDWIPREEPLRPVAIAASGQSAVRLARRMMAKGPHALEPFYGVAAEELFILMGPSEKLPWIDGCLYLGRDEDAPGLLLPTQMAPSVPLGMFEQALKRAFPERGLPLAVLPKSGRIVSLQKAGPVDRVMLRQWADAQPLRRAV